MTYRQDNEVNAGSNSRQQDHKDKCRKTIYLDIRGCVIPNHKREATDRASSMESLPTREAITDLVISERRFLTK
ncbi:MAG: hypothetical protein ACK56L_22715, partial [Pseudanabaena sp.]